MLFFNTEFDIYPNAQSPDFKPGTVSQSPGFKLGTVSQSPGFKPGTITQSPGFKSGTVFQSPGFKPGTVPQSPGFKPNTAPQSPGLNLALYLKNPSFKPGTYAIHLPYFQTQAFKNSEISNQLTILSNKELCNPVSPSLMEIRRSKVKPYRAP